SRAREKDRKQDETRELDDFAKQIIQRIDAVASAVEKTLSQQKKFLQSEAPRDQKEHNRLRPAVREHHSALQQAIADLPKAGTSKSLTAGELRNAAADYLKVLDDLLQWFDDRFITDRLPSEEEAKLGKKHTRDLQLFRKEWEIAKRKATA